LDGLFKGHAVTTSFPATTRSEQGAARVVGPYTTLLDATLGLFMRLIEPISVRFGADHLLRDPIPYLEAAGFVISESRRTGRGGVTFRVLAQKPAD
jgi:hypothetical protein